MVENVRISKNIYEGITVTNIFFLLYDVKVKRYPMALSLVKLHKQPKGLGERPVLGR